MKIEKQITITLTTHQEIHSLKNALLNEKWRGEVSNVFDRVSGKMLEPSKLKEHLANVEGILNQL